VEVRDLRRDEVPAAVAVLARGMRDNPIHITAFGDDPDHRRHALERLFRALFDVMSAQTPICAVEGGEIVGVTGIAPPGGCRPSRGQRLRLTPTMLSFGPRASARVAKWFGAWAARDPDEPHSHLGPLAVDPPLQGRGIGSEIMREYTRRLDDSGELGYLETDRPENVPFYERHGFEVIGQEDVLNVPNWFMRRDATAGRA
jgi:ribosomal protein S18 acetylase RimI-like enzyme